MSDTTKKAAFSWDEKNSKIVAEMYTASGNDNSKKNLDTIAESVGAKSAASVRAKLSSDKVYVLSTTTAGKARTPKASKQVIVNNLESILGLKKDALDTLEKANVTALEALTKAVVYMGSDQAITDSYDIMEERHAAEEEKELEKAKLQEAVNAAESEADQELSDSDSDSEELA